MAIQFDVDRFTRFAAKLVVLLRRKLGGIEPFLDCRPMRADQILPVIFITKFFQFLSEGTSPIPVNRLSFCCHCRLPHPVIIEALSMHAPGLSQ